MSRSVASAAAELSARAPEERRLDAFAASAAHSLGTGVSIASGYATLLRERFAGQLGDEGLTVLAGLDGGLQRMRLFMDDLLELAALDRTPLERAPLELDPVAAAAVDTLAPTIEEAGVEVDVAPLPAVVGDGAMLERLFHHLLRGGIAGIGAGPGRIAITGARRAAGARIEVDDTGPALEPAAAARLFETFAPPRGSGPAAGAGVGMAIARRIVERHGGSIWARPGRRDGCTIVVLIPAEPA
jgi:signal transduction histidine kinase